MADLTAFSSQPKVTFVQDVGPGNPVWRFYYDSAFRTQWYSSILSTWKDFLIFDGDVTSFADITLDKSDPTLTFDTGGTNDYDITSDGDMLQFNEDGASLLELTGTGHKSKANLTIDKSNPTVTLDTGGTNDYSLTSSGSELEFKEGGATLLELSGTGHTSLKNVTIKTSAPTITFDDTSATADFKVKVDGGSMFFADTADRAFMQIRATDSYFVLSHVTGGGAEAQFSVTPVDVTSDCHVQVGMGDNTRGKVSILRDETNGNERMGVLILQDTAGVDWYLHVDTSGIVYIKNSDPGTTPSGTKVGTQS